MRPCMMLLAALIGLAGEAAVRAEPGAAYHVGEADRIVTPRRARLWRGSPNARLTVRLWYPIDRRLAEAPRDIGPPGTPFFHGEPARPDAPLAPARRRYPLILLSHGTGGTAEDLDWLAAALARAGYIVASANHPGNNALEPMTWAGFSLWWERAADVSDMIDALLIDPVLGARIDAKRIGAAGFSIGGYTMLALAGARTDVARLRAFCDGPTANAGCRPAEMQRIIDPPVPGAEPSAEVRASLARSGEDYRDARIRAVFAIAPAVGQAFDAKGLADVKVPVLLMAGARDAAVPPATNAAYLANLLKAPLISVPGAGHYSFLPPCAPAALARMPMLCREEGDMLRAAIHAQAIDAAIGFFGRTLRR